MKALRHEHERELEVQNASLEQTLAKVESDTIKLARFIEELENRKDSVERSIFNFETLIGGAGLKSTNQNSDHSIAMLDDLLEKWVEINDLLNEKQPMMIQANKAMD